MTEQLQPAGRMTIWSLLKNILPYVLPYRKLVVITLVLTFIGSLMAQVNAVVLDRSVDAINALVQSPDGFRWSRAISILTAISAVLLGKEVVGAVVTFFQRYYGERLRILVSRDLSLRVVDRILAFRMAYFAEEGNETGKLQSRIDRGIMSMSNFDILHADNEVETTGTHKPDTVKGDFTLSHVNFTYPNGTRALTDVSMHIEPGKITALVGLSGAGKSTVVNLLDKFFAPDSGSLKLDGVEVSDWDTRWLRENVGLVLQKNHIFDGTIAENIRYGNPNATPDDIVRAARQAFLYDQVSQLPRGFDTPALQLSGGQQQRVAIARMFLKNPPIIFLDEPTASLDAIATEQIKASIDAIKQGRTVIIISHNIGQIIDADQIYVLERGRVVQSGSPQEVYRQGGLYKDIFDASARSMNVDKIANTIDS